ncbi:hypothetical protein [Archangium primigenium]|uniref:hypothetical protein n=1 Tax=[Archangium] primigenium TaxID=2792470 RepID=UPI00195AE974|nr:hypothetical protein [Archangium primigenium]MBM7119348.1 hypothetical protein [Archangium primigenium]
MTEPSPERVKSAIQALSQARPVEGPPGDDGQRSVWHLSPQGAELLSFVDSDGRVQRQELTLLGEHCVWTSGVGLRTGRVEQEGASRAETSVVHPDLEPVPARLLRAAVALEDYQGEDRYILHMQRVLALARQGLVMAGGPAPVAVAAPVVQEPPAPGVSRVPSGGTPLATPKHEGLTMLLVLGVGLIVGVGLMLWLL